MIKIQKKFEFIKGYNDVKEIFSTLKNPIIKNVRPLRWHYDKYADRYYQGFPYDLENDGCLIGNKEKTFKLINDFEVENSTLLTKHLWQENAKKHGLEYVQKLRAYLISKIDDKLFEIYPSFEINKQQ